MRFDWLTLVWLVGRVAARRAAAAAARGVEGVGLLDGSGDGVLADGGGVLLDGSVAERCACNARRK